MSAVEAINRLADGIADPYSSEPEVWRSAVRRIMSGTYELADGAPPRNRYSLSEAVSPPQA